MCIFYNQGKAYYFRDQGSIVEKKKKEKWGYVS